MRVTPQSDGRDRDERSDLELVAALNEGDISAFEGLYWRYRDWVGRLALRFTGNEADALDVLQETFSYLHRKFPGFDLTARMTTFLYPVVRNLSLAARRKRRPNLAEDELLNVIPEPHSLSPQSDTADLASALSSLPAIHREILLMRFVDDLSLAEIAQAAAIPLGTVKSRLHHAIAALRADEKIKQYFLEQ